MNKLSVGEIVYIVAKGLQSITPEQFAAICRMACEANDFRALLQEVYEQHGPRGGTARAMAPVDYAAMTTEQIDADWDFPDRHFMHRIAKALVA